VEQSTLSTMRTEENVDVKENVNEERENPIKTSIETNVEKEKEEIVSIPETKEEKQETSQTQTVNTNQNQKSAKRTKTRRDAAKSTNNKCPYIKKQIIGVI